MVNKKENDLSRKELFLIFYRVKKKKKLEIKTAKDEKAEKIRHFA